MDGRKKITCKAFLEDVSDYLDDDLAPDLRVSLEAHIAKCPDCWVLFDETRRSVEVVQQSDCHRLPDEVKERLMGALRQRWEK